MITHQAEGVTWSAAALGCGVEGFHRKGREARKGEPKQVNHRERRGTRAQVDVGQLLFADCQLLVLRADFISGQTGLDSFVHGGANCSFLVQQRRRRGGFVAV